MGSLQVQGIGGQRRRGEIYEAESDGRCQAAASRLLTRKGKGSGVELLLSPGADAEGEGAVQPRADTGVLRFCTLIPWPWRAVA